MLILTPFLKLRPFSHNFSTPIRLIFCAVICVPWMTSGQPAQKSCDGKATKTPPTQSCMVVPTAIGVVFYLPVGFNPEMLVDGPHPPEPLEPAQPLALKLLPASKATLSGIDCFSRHRPIGALGSFAWLVKSRCKRRLFSSD